MKHQTIMASTDPSVIRKAGKFFSGSLTSIFIELLQNAYRAQAKQVTVTVEGDLIRVTDDGVGIADPAVMLRFGGSGWKSDTIRSQDAAGMGVFCLAAQGCEVRSRAAGAAEGWSARFTPGVFVGEAPGEVTWSAETPHGTEISFIAPESERHNDKVGQALAATATYAPMSVSLVTIDATGARDVRELGGRDFLEGALAVEDHGAYRIGVFNEFDGRRRATWFWNRDAKSCVNFHGLVIPFGLDAIAPVFGEKFMALVDLRSAEEIQMTLPQRDRIIENDAATRLQEQARRAILAHIATMDSHGFPYAVVEEARSMGFPMKDAEPMLRKFVPSSADWQTTTEGGWSPVTDEGAALVLDAYLEADEEQSLDHALGKVTGRTFFDAEDSFAGFRWYDRLPKITGVRWRVRTAGGERVIDREADERQERVSGDGLGSDEPIESIEAMLSLSCDGREVGTETVSTDFLIEATDCWCADDVTLLVTETAKRDGLLEVGYMVDRVMAAFFSPSDDGECDSYETQREHAEREATILATRRLLSERVAALGAIEDAFGRFVLDACRQLTKQGGTVTITVSGDRFEVKTTD